MNEDDLMYEALFDDDVEVESKRRFCKGHKINIPFDFEAEIDRLVSSSSFSTEIHHFKELCLLYRVCKGDRELVSQYSPIGVDDVLWSKLNKFAYKVILRPAKPIQFTSGEIEFLDAIPKEKWRVVAYGVLGVFKSTNLPCIYRPLGFGELYHALGIPREKMATVQVWRRMIKYGVVESFEYDDMHPCAFRPIVKPSGPVVSTYRDLWDMKKLGFRYKDTERIK